MLAEVLELTMHLLLIGHCDLSHQRSEGGRDATSWLSLHATEESFTQLRAIDRSELIIPPCLASFILFFLVSFCTSSLNVHPVGSRS